MGRTTRERAFHDPVHDFITLNDSLLLELIDTRNFNVCAAFVNSADPTVRTTAPNILGSAIPWAFYGLCSVCCAV